MIKPLIQTLFPSARYLLLTKAALDQANISHTDIEHQSIQDSCFGFTIPVEIQRDWYY